MNRDVKFVLNRGAFRSQILQGSGTVGMLEAIMGAAGGSNQQTLITSTRGRVSVSAPLAREARTGELSRLLGRLRA